MVRQAHHRLSEQAHQPAVERKYTRKKINDGTLEDWKKQMFLEVVDMKDMKGRCAERKKIERIIR